MRPPRSLDLDHGRVLPPYLRRNHGCGRRRSRNPAYAPVLLTRLVRTHASAVSSRYRDLEYLPSSGHAPDSRATHVSRPATLLVRAHVVRAHAPARKVSAGAK